MSIAKTLAQLIQAAAKMYEESYDRVAADAASLKADAERQVDPSNIYVGHVDYAKFYRLSMRQACENACAAADEPRLGEPVYLMLSSWWNDTNDWASSVTGCGMVDKLVHENMVPAGFKLDNVGPRGQEPNA